MRPEPESPYFGKLKPGYECPVIRQQRHAVKLGEEMLSALRRLRKAITACKRCPILENCDRREALNHIIDAALRDAADEWGIAR